MRALVIICLVIAGCYSPELAPCTVHCGAASPPCPADLTCGDDHHCHAPGDTNVCVEDFLVTVEKSGTGSGLVTGDLGLNCGSTCTTTTTKGVSITFAATYDDGSRFAGWSGPCGGTDDCTLTVADNTTVGAVFNLAHVVSVSFVGDGTGDVESMPGGISCTSDCSAAFDADSDVTLTAIADMNSMFVGWSGGCTGTDPCTIMLTDDAAVTAEFEPM